MSIVVVIGATSGIGEAIGREFASIGFDLVLAGRDRQALDLRVKDLEIRYGVRAWSRLYDALDCNVDESWVAECVQAIGEPIFGFVLCYGAMADEAKAASNSEVASRMIDVNYRSVVLFLNQAATYLEGRGAGFLCAVTSVAGDRGRASNYHYGSTKGAVSTYLSGLRVRLFKAGVNVTDLRPGMVDTKLTYGLPKLVLVASPRGVARDAVRGILKNRAIVYSPRFWVLIMFVIRSLPDVIFKRLNL